MVEDRREPSTGTAVASYTERLYAPLSWWLLGAAFATAVWWAFFVAAAPPVAWAAGLVAATLVVAGLASYGGVRLRVSVDGLHAGRAHLPWDYAGEALALDAAATKRQLGVEADARAYLIARTYCPASVRVQVVDEDDPVPYWLLSSRHPDLLAAQINAHRGVGRGVKD